MINARSYENADPLQEILVAGNRTVLVTPQKEGRGVTRMITVTTSSPENIVDGMARTSEKELGLVVALKHLDGIGKEGDRVYFQSTSDVIEKAIANNIPQFPLPPIFAVSEDGKQHAWHREYENNTAEGKPTYATVKAPNKKEYWLRIDTVIKLPDRGKVVLHVTYLGDKFDVAKTAANRVDDPLPSLTPYTFNLEVNELLRDTDTVPIAELVRNRADRVRTMLRSEEDRTSRIYTVLSGLANAHDDLANLLDNDLKQITKASKDLYKQIRTFIAKAEISTKKFMAMQNLQPEEAVRVAKAKKEELKSCGFITRPVEAIVVGKVINLVAAAQKDNVERTAPVPKDLVLGVELKLPAAESAAELHHTKRLKKDNSRSLRATQFIGSVSGAMNDGVTPTRHSSFAKDWQAAGRGVNTGRYTANDVIFLALDGSNFNKGHILTTEGGKDIKAAFLAAHTAGATFLLPTDEETGQPRARDPYSVYRKIKTGLAATGYTQVGTTGEWVKAEAKSEQPEEQQLR